MKRCKVSAIESVLLKFSILLDDNGAPVLIFTTPFFIKAM